MSKEEMICKNCKYHYIEEISFDYPQSCCDKRKAVIEEWFNCNDFEYSDKYIEQLQLENEKLKEGLDETILRLKTCVLELMDIAKQDYYWIVSNKIERAKDEIISYKIMGNNDTKFFIDKGDNNE